MKHLSYIFSLILVIAIAACKKQLPDTAGPKGFLKSVSAYLGRDSITYNDRYSIETGFTYDEAKRVKEITTLHPTGQGYSTFYYHGQSTNPYLLVDSGFADIYSFAVIKKYYLSYNSNGKKTADSFTLANRNFNTGILDTLPASSAYARFFDHHPGYDSVYSPYFYNSYDLIYKNSENDIVRNRHWSSITTHDVIYGESYNELNPLRLNVSEGMFGIINLFNTFFDPLEEGHQTSYNKYLSKEISGVKTGNGICNNNHEFVKINTYFSKNTNNQIDRLVFAVRSFVNGQLCQTSYCHLVLKYYP